MGFIGDNSGVGGMGGSDGMGGRGSTGDGERGVVGVDRVGVDDRGVPGVVVARVLGVERGVFRLERGVKRRAEEGLRGESGCGGNEVVDNLANARGGMCSFAGEDEGMEVGGDVAIGGALPFSSITLSSGISAAGSSDFLRLCSRFCLLFCRASTCCIRYCICVSFLVGVEMRGVGAFSCSVCS
jgi:hypothetical protein